MASGLPSGHSGAWNLTLASGSATAPRGAKVNSQTIRFAMKKADFGGQTWSFFLIGDVGDIPSYEIKTLFLQEMFARGILTLGSHNMSYAHSDADVDQLLAAYDAVLPILRDAVDNRAVRQYLNAEPLRPLFRVR